MTLLFFFISIHSLKFLLSNGEEKVSLFSLLHHHRCTYTGWLNRPSWTVHWRNPSGQVFNRLVALLGCFCSTEDLGYCVLTSLTAFASEHVMTTASVLHDEILACSMWTAACIVEATIHFYRCKRSYKWMWCYVEVTYWSCRYNGYSVVPDGSFLPMRLAALLC